MDNLLEHDLRLLEETMEEVIAKAPAIMESMKRIADIARSVSFTESDASITYKKLRRARSRELGKERKEKKAKADGESPERWESVKHRRDDGDYELVVSDGTMMKARQVQATPAEMEVMAAAPEMLDALKVILDSANNYMGAFSVSVEAIQSARNALEKAEGGDSE